MHRQPLLQLLSDYHRRFPAEAAVVARFEHFVRAEPRCFERDLWLGHVTGSAWLVNHARDHVLLTHHRKLRRWLQLGGHSDGNPDVLTVARNEAMEESGLEVAALATDVFDIDIHEIPARRQDPAHFHFDVRFVLQVTGAETFRVGPESLDLAWVPIAALDAYTTEESMLRMARKWPAFLRQLSS
jgi:8-oxo-dGTP pyrophosphatase MutT (NUDIX family)